jgi:transposase-like protein
LYAKGKRRFVRCRTCREEFSERKGTPLFQMHLPPEKAFAVLSHVAEGCGIRETGRLVGVTKDTVVALVKRAGEHAQVCTTNWHAT